MFNSKFSTTYCLAANLLLVFSWNNFKLFHLKDSFILVDRSQNKMSLFFSFRIPQSLLHLLMYSLIFFCVYFIWRVRLSWGPPHRLPVATRNVTIFLLSDSWVSSWSPSTCRPVSSQLSTTTSTRTTTTTTITTTTMITTITTWTWIPVEVLLRYLYLFGNRVVFQNSLLSKLSSFRVVIFGAHFKE